MPVMIRDKHLEDALDIECERRSNSSLAKTLSDLARERLMQINPSSLAGTQPIASPTDARAGGSGVAAIG